MPLGARVALLLVLAGACGCGEPQSPDGTADRPDVLLVTLDTTRADRLGCYGHAAAATPVLDGLASRGLLFEKAWSPAPLTLPSHASILSGLYPVEHGARDNGLYRVGEECLLLPEVLSAEGWRTGAFISSAVLSKRFGLGQGFDDYHGFTAETEGGAAGPARAAADVPALVWTPSNADRSAAAVVDDALAWLAGQPRARPVFAWVHFYDPHAAYAAPEPFASQLDDPYDAEIAYVDHELGRLLDGLRQRRPGERLLVVVTADHGESLGEHGEPTHSVFLYEATQHVPLIVVLPDGSEAGRRVAVPVSVVDIAPTILQALKIPRERMERVRVPSLLASAAAAAGGATDADEPLSSPAPADPDRPGAERAIYLETLGPLHEHRWHPLRGVVWDGHKLVESPRPELYALRDDPREERDRYVDEPERAAALRGRLEALLAAHPPLAGGAEAHSPDAAELEALQSLGYLGGAVEGDPFDPSLPAPRDRAHLLVPQLEASTLLAQAASRLSSDPAGGQSLLAQARSRFESLYASAPDDPQNALGLANLELTAGRPAQAREPLERYVLALPRDVRARFALATCYADTGHEDWACAEMEKATRIDPLYRAPYFWLADAHARRGERGVAAWWLAELEAVGAGTRRAEVAARLATLREAARRADQPVAPPARRAEHDWTPEGLR
jgi:choline-sulfatase